MYEFVERLSVDERRGSVDPVEGLVTMLAALNSASAHEAGVGGYPTVLLIDGKKPIKERQQQFADDRSWMATRAVKAWTNGFMSRKDCHEMVDGLFFKSMDADECYSRFWTLVKEPQKLSRLLRGYKIEPLVP